MNFGNGNMINNFGNLPNYNALSAAVPQDEYRKVKIIKNIDEVFPNEIPTDGNWGIYILEDYSKIYLLRQGIGGIQRNEYSLIVPDSPSVETLTAAMVQEMIAENNEKMMHDIKNMINNRQSYKSKGGMNHGK